MNNTEMSPQQAVEQERRLALLRRITASSGFGRSARLSAFLNYVVERSLAELPEEITEQQIGVQVYGRNAAYNPGEDNIVRAQARVLRAKLEAYFTTEGSQEPLILEIPKGGYIPRFVDRPVATPLENARPLDLRPADTSLQGSQIRVVIMGMAALALFASGWMLHGFLTPVVVQQPSESPRFQAFWNRILATSKPILFVAPDQGHSIAAEVFRRDFTLADYVLKRPALEWNADAERALSLPDLPRRNYSMMDAVSLAARISELAAQRGRTLTVRNCRDLSRREISNGLVIFVGTPASNPWLELFETKINFAYAPNTGRRPQLLRNREPGGGESAEFRATATGGMNETYGSIFHRVGLDGESSVLVFGGMNMEATEATAMLLLQPMLFEKLLAPVLKVDRPYFELVAKSKSMAGSSTSPEVVALRLYPD
jgi:hypothetical protein